MSYTLIDNGGRDKKYIKIDDEGSNIIWAAYEKMFGKNCQSMDRREARGGIAYLSELDLFKKEGALDKDFDYTKHIITNPL